MSIEGIHDLQLFEGNVDGDRFTTFVRNCILPILQPFNWINPHSVVIMDNASIHHVDAVSELIENQGGARLHFLPPYSPDLNPMEGVFGQVKSIVKENDSPVVLLSVVFAMISRLCCPCNSLWVLTPLSLVMHSYNITGLQCTSSTFHTCNKVNCCHSGVPCWVQLFKQCHD